MITKIKQYLFDNKKHKNNEGVLNSLSDDDRFLLDNRILRLDANRYDIFDKTRCDFHADRYRFACEYTEGRVVLDCASGLGYGVDIMSRLGRAKSVFGLELDEAASEYATRKYGTSNAFFGAGSILNIPHEDNKFDIFTSFETIEHIENEDLQFHEIKRVLKNNGLYILYTPNDWGSDSVNPYHVRHYTYNSLRERLSKNFKILRIYNQNSGTPNRQENHNQPRSIYITTEENHCFAECFIAVCINIK